MKRSTGLLYVLILGSLLLAACGPAATAVTAPTQPATAVAAAPSATPAPTAEPPTQPSPTAPAATPTPEPTTAPAAEAGASALVGRYVRSDPSAEFVMDIVSDGMAYWPVNWGSYTVSGDQITFTAQSDCQVPSVYQWSLDGTALKLTVVKDECGTGLIQDSSQQDVTLTKEPDIPFRQVLWRTSGNSGPDGAGDLQTLAVDAQGNVYATRGDPSTFSKFSPDGKLLGTWGGFGTGDGQFQRVGGMAVDEQGNMYVSDYGGVRIEKFDPSGKYLTSFKLDVPMGPRGVGVDKEGNVYFALHGKQPDHFVEKWTSDGKLLATWGSPGTGDGQFSAFGPDGGPRGINVDSQGNVYVTDPDNDRVQKFDSNGKFLLSLTGSGDQTLEHPFSVAIDSADNAYVPDESFQLREFDPSGKFLAVWRMWPDAVRIAPDGKVYIAEIGELEQVELPQQ